MTLEDKILKATSKITIDCNLDQDNDHYEEQDNNIDEYSYEGEGKEDYAIYEEGEDEEELEVEEIDEMAMFEMLEEEQNSLELCCRLFKNKSPEPESWLKDNAYITEQLVQSLKTQGYVVMDDLFGQDIIESCRKTVFDWYANGEMMKAIDHRVEDDPFRDRKARDDYILWLNNEENLANIPACFISLLEISTAVENEISEIFHLNGKSEIQVALFKENSTGYQLHRDAFPTDDLSDIDQRRLTLILYINDKNWDDEKDGGNLKLGRRKETIECVSPVGGRAVLFFSGVMDHQVMSSSKERIAMTTWMS